MTDVDERKQNMGDVDERKMTAEEWRQEHDLLSWFAYEDQIRAMRKYGAISPDLDAALGTYMAALDDPEAKAVALERFDATLVRLREVYRECDWDWEAG